LGCVFDRYFNFAIPEGDVSQGVIERFLNLAGDREGLRQELRSLRDQGLLDVMMDRLEAYKEEIPLEHAVPFITAIFDVGEDLSVDLPGMFDISPAMHASRIVYWFLRRESRPEERANILRHAIGDTDGLSLPVRFVSLEEQAATARDKPRDRLLNDEGLAAPKQLCVEKIAAADAAGTLVEVHELAMILYRWRDWAGEEPVQTFCTKLVTTPAGAVRLAEAFLQRTSSHTLGDYVGRHRYYMNLGELERFAPLKELEQQLARIDESSLTENQRRAVAAFRAAVRRRKEGKPDTGWGRFDDEDE
jgi:predicted KAP-like P-loop ATPase